jgi:heparanase
MSVFGLIFLVGKASSFDLVLDIQNSLRSQRSDSPYVCVTMDWWPENKCDGPDGISDCAWEGANILSAPIESVALRSALYQLGNVTLRLGGSLADGVIYLLGDDENRECINFTPEAPTPSRTFRNGCLSKSRWNSLMSFCQNDCQLVFGLNAMLGRSCENVDPTHCPCFYSDQTCTSSYDTSNVEALIRYTAGSAH